MLAYKRRVDRVCSVLIAAALLVRLVSHAGLERRAVQAFNRALSAPEAAGFLFYLELGQAFPLPEGVPEPAPAAEGEPAPEPIPAPEPVPDPVPVPEPEPEPAPVAELSPAPEPEPVLLTFTEADADGIEIAGRCSYSVDKLGLLQRAVSLDFEQDGPTVLIVHTHTCEAYAQEAGWEYPEDGAAHTMSPGYTVARVGDELAEVLESHGIGVIHDTSVNDYPDFNAAYYTALDRIEAQLAAHPTIQMVIDVHRDAAEGGDGLPVSRTALVDGEPLAQLMLVVGTDEGGLYHPNWRDNLSWALKLQAVLNREWPGLCRSIDLRTERFNQHATPGSLLVEVGASGNTLRQAILSARLLGEGLAELIEGT